MQQERHPYSHKKSMDLPRADTLQQHRAKGRPNVSLQLIKNTHVRIKEY